MTVARPSRPGVPIDLGFVPLIPPGGQPVTQEMVRTLREEFGD
jgi:hypothetical protein